MNTSDKPAGRLLGVDYGKVRVGLAEVPDGPLRVGRVREDREVSAQPLAVRGGRTHVMGSKLPRALEVATELVGVNPTAHAATKLRVRERAIAGVRDGIERITGTGREW